MSGWIYCMTNEYFPDLVKIGCTDRSPEDRRRELSADTGVPAPFFLAYAAQVDRAYALEQAVHQRLKNRRLPGKEFFSVDVADAIIAIKTAALASRLAIGEEIDGIAALAEAEERLAEQQRKKAEALRKERLDAAHKDYVQRIEDIAQEYRRELAVYRERVVRGAAGRTTPNAFFTLVTALFVTFVLLELFVFEAHVALIGGGVTALLWHSMIAERIGKKRQRAQTQPWVMEIDRRSELIDQYVHWHGYHYQDGLEDFFKSQMEAIMRSGGVREDGIAASSCRLPKPAVAADDSRKINRAPIRETIRS